MDKLIEIIKNDESWHFGQALVNAGFDQDRFGVFHKVMPDGTKVTFYKSYYGWTCDVFTASGDHLTEKDIDVIDLLDTYTN